MKQILKKIVYHSDGNKGAFKYFIGYNDCNVLIEIKKYMNLLGNDDKLLEKYNEKWDKIEKLFKTKLIVKQCAMINTLKLKQVYIT